MTIPLPATFATFPVACTPFTNPFPSVFPIFNPDCPNFFNPLPTLDNVGNAVLNPSAKLPAALNLSNINIPLDIPLNKGAKPFVNPPSPILNAANPATDFIIPAANCGFF